MISVRNLNNNSNSYKVLLVENLTEQAEKIKQLLVNNNWRQIYLSKVASISQAKQKLKRESFDVILWNISLTDGQNSDISFVEEITRKVPIIVLVGCKNEKLAQQLLQLGVQDYFLTEKLDRENLIRSMRYAIEKHRSQIALQHQEAQFRSVFENSLVGIAIVNFPSLNLRNDCWVEVNDALCSLLGYSPPELLKKPWLELIHPDDRQFNLELFCQILACESEGYSSNLKLLCKDNRVVRVQASVRPIRNSDSAIDRLVVVISDISDRYCYEQQLQASHQFFTHAINAVEQAEAALQKSQRFIQQIAEASPNILYLYDLREQRNIYTNRSLGEILGYTAKEIQQMGATIVPNLLHPEDLAKLPESLQTFATVKDGEIVEFEYRMRHRDGSWRWLCSRDTIFTRSPDGQPLQVLGTASDITARKQSEIEIRLLLAATQAISESQDFHQALAVVLRLLCTNIGWDFGETWIASVRGDSRNFDRLVLEYSPGWYASDRSLDKFGCLSENLTYTIGEGLPGRIWLKGQPEWIEDVTNTNDLAFHRSDIAAAVGLKACFGVPIRTQGEVLAVLVFFKQTESAKEPHLVELVNAIATQLGEYIQRKKTEAALLLSEKRLQLALEASAMGLWDWNISTGEAYFDLQWKKMLGYEEEEIENSYQAWEKLVHPEDLPRVLQILNDHLQGVTPRYEVEYRMKTKSGDWKWISCQGKVFERDESWFPLRMIGTHKDISDRKIAEEIEQRLIASLQESEARFRIMADSAPVLLWMSNQEGLYTFFNQTWLTFTGRDVEKELGNGWIEGLHPEDSQRYFNIYMKAFQSRRNFQIEYRLQRADGEYRWILDTGVPRFTSRGHFLGYIGSCVDINDRIVAEEELRKSEERWQLVLKGNNDGIWDLNLQTNQVFRSSRYREILGYKDGEFGDSLNEWIASIHPDDLQGVMQINKDYLSRKIPYYALEYRLRCKDGTYKWVLARGQAVWDEAGNPIRMVGATTDISDRKMLEDKLRSSYVEMNAVFEAMSDIILVIDAELKNINIAPTNPARLYPANINIINLTVEQFTTGKEAETFLAQIRQALAAKKTVDFEYRLCINQEEFWFFARISPISEKAVIWVARDISDRKQVESALVREAERSAAANRAKSEFLANMSHEVRTPLNGILGYTQILKTDSNLTETQQAHLTTIQQCGEHLLTLIDDVLDLSKIEARKMELRPTELMFPNFIKSLADFFQMRAAQKNISFTCRFLPPLPNCVRADEKRLRQVLINLLSNAVKFTNRGGVIFQVDVVSDETNYYQLPTFKIRFLVEDSGIGIEESELEEIFLPFHQVSDRLDSIEGTGLGLSISQRLVQLMGGEIKVESSLDKGSVFWFDIDLPTVEGCNELNNGHKKGKIIGFTGNKRKVLIADDNGLNRAILRSLLVPLGFEIQEAINGQDCLNKAVEFQPDVILIDVVMPGMDGFEVTRRLRQLPEIQDVILLALSANVFESTKQESIVAGCDNFLAKPIQNTQLLERLRIHLGIEWIYEESAKISSSQKEFHPAATFLIPPSQEAIATLLRLAMLGDIEGILEDTNKLENFDNKLTPFLSHLRQLAKGFQLKQIREFLKQYIET